MSFFSCRMVEENGQTINEGNIRTSILSKFVQNVLSLLLYFLSVFYFSMRYTEDNEYLKAFICIVAKEKELQHIFNFKNMTRSTTDNESLGGLVTGLNEKLFHINQIRIQTQGEWRQT